MTAIVGFATDNTIYMAGDRLGSNSYYKEEVAEKKVFKNGNFVFGFSGTFRLGEILEYIFIPPEHKNGLSDKNYLVTTFIPKLRETLESCKFVKSDDKKSEDVIFIMGYNGKLYKVQNDWSVIENTHKYSSIGSGSEYCLGAMNVLKDIDTIKPKDKVIKAIESASKHNPFVGGTIDVITLKYKRKERYE